VSERVRGSAQTRKTGNSVTNVLGWPHPRSRSMIVAHGRLVQHGQHVLRQLGTADLPAQSRRRCGSLQRALPSRRQPLAPGPPGVFLDQRADRCAYPNSLVDPHDGIGSQTLQTHTSELVESLTSVMDELRDVTNANVARYCE